jgi:sialate O-acetylesterase
VADRLARLVLGYTYKRPLAAEGPIPLEAVKEGSIVVISFSFAEQLSTKGKKPLEGFQLVTEKGAHISGKAIIKNNQVHIFIPKEVEVKEVLYGWAPFTRANLVNEAGLPASTFSLKLHKKN